MIYLGSPRFQVRELEGYAQATYGGSNGLPGLHIAVIDRAYCAQVVMVWCSEDYHAGGNGPRTMTAVKIRARIREEARVRCEELNEGGRCTGGPVLPYGDRSPSLSPFDSGCPR